MGDQEPVTAEGHCEVRRNELFACALADNGASERELR